MAKREFIPRFSPNRTDAKILEAIFVQRHTLADVWLESLKESVLGGTKHHLLAVGPRGSGKSHLVALLLSRLNKDSKIKKQVRIAWLPEDETTASFWKFLLRIHRALNNTYGDEFPPPPSDELMKATDDRRTKILTDHLLKHLKKRTLLVVVENLDEALRGMKLEGQKRWRSFLQEHPVSATLATSQQLTNDLSSREKPFFNFFQVERLHPLSSGEATELLHKVADLNKDQDLAEFLETPTGRARVRAIRHIAGGRHRVFMILSEFVTRESLDDLVSAFEQLLDGLTPYYQERLRWLPDQQREIVEYLCRLHRTASVKDIASTLFLSEQTTAAQLKSLKEKGYVTSASVGRESRYELAEPLMRLCIELKDPRREPIRLVVDFLKTWYDHQCNEVCRNPIDLIDLDERSQRVQEWRRAIFGLAEKIKNATDPRERRLGLDESCASPIVAISTVQAIALSLVDTLITDTYKSENPESLRDWVQVWHELAEAKPEFSFAVRLFEVGIRYIQEKDERVLFDLVSEERRILRDLFKLDKEEADDE